MAVVKFSQLPFAGSNPAAGDQVVGLVGGAVDTLFTFTQMSATIAGLLPPPTGSAPVNSLQYNAAGTLHGITNALSDGTNITRLRASSTGTIGFDNGAGVGAVTDVNLYRDAPGIIGTHDGNNPQDIAIYGGAAAGAAPTVYERGNIGTKARAGVFTIGTQWAGGGNPRTITIEPGTGITNFYTGVASTGGGGTPIFSVNGSTNIVQANSTWPFGWGSGDVSSGQTTGIYQAIAGVVSFNSSTAVLGGTWRAVANSPTALASGTTANYNPGNNSFFQRITANAANSALSGWSTNGAAAQVDGQMHLIVNIGTGSLTLNHQDVGSTTANRFLCSTGANIVLTTNQAVDMIYDFILSSWRVFKRN